MGRGVGGGEACIIGCIWRSPLFWVARSNQITGLRKTPLGREIWLTANPLTENLAQIGYRPYYQRAGIREISRLRSHVLGKFPGKSSSLEISREISREMPQLRSQFPGKFPGEFHGESAAGKFPGKFPGKLAAHPCHFPGNYPRRWLPQPISREIGIGSQILPISHILYFGAFLKP